MARGEERSRAGPSDQRCCPSNAVILIIFSNVKQLLCHHYKNSVNLIGRQTMILLHLIKVSFLFIFLVCYVKGFIIFFNV